MRLGGAVVFPQRCDGGFELGLDGRALATGQAASQFGAQFVDVVLKRDHRPLLLFEDGAGAPRRSGRVKDAEGAAKRGAGEPILPRATKEVRALARSLRAAKLGEAAASLGRPDRRGKMGDLRRENGIGGVCAGHAKTRPDCSGRGDVAGANQSPLDLRPRDQIRLKVSPPSSSKRLA
jgi:hypothetical protein